MDRRQLKKEIIYAALAEFQKGSPIEKMIPIFDKYPSPAQSRRFNQLLREMVENAETKLR
jgi:hypothetical protein